MLIGLICKKYVAIDSVIMDLNMEYHAIKCKILREEYKKWKKELTREEVKEIRKYRIGKVAAGKRNINAYLRNNTQNNNKKNYKIKILKNAISKAKINDNIATYRTINKIECDYIKKFSRNEIFENKDFKGTHVSRYIFKNITSAYVIYLIPKGYKCAYINYWVPIFMYEKELLLNCGSKCRIVDVKKIFEKDRYIVEVLN